MKKIYSHNIPTFKPYKELKVGSNIMKNVKFLINISGYIPLVIGKGESGPKIWLYGLKDNKILKLIENNNSLFTQIQQGNRFGNGVLEWKLRNIQTDEMLNLLKVEYTESFLNITKMDLRCIGIKVYIENNVLVVGNMRIENNTVEGVNSLINIES